MIMHWQSKMFSMQKTIIIHFVFRIWDKLCGGSYKILVYVIVVLLTTLKRSILKCSTVPEILQCIKNVSVCEIKFVFF